MELKQELLTEQPLKLLFILYLHKIIYIFFVYNKSNTSISSFLVNTFEFHILWKKLQESLTLLQLGL